MVRVVVIDTSWLFYSLSMVRPEVQIAKCVNADQIVNHYQCKIYQTTLFIYMEKVNPWQAVDFAICLSYELYTNLLLAKSYKQAIPCLNET